MARSRFGTPGRRRRAPPAAADETNRWLSVNLIDRSVDVVRADPRAAEIDPQGRFCLLYVQSTRGDVRDEGSLFFLRDGDETRIRERIALGSPDLDRRMSPESVALAFRRDCEPTIVFRRRTAEKSPYDGMFHLGARKGADNWNYQAIHAHGNLGFYPAIIMSPDRDAVTAIVHFSFGGFDLLRSRPAQGAGWQIDALGLQGDGLHLTLCRNPNGPWHVVFKPNRFNSDPAPSVYLR